MNKRTTISILILILAIGTGFFIIYPQFIPKVRKTEKVETSNQETKFSKGMYGHILQLKDNIITINGTINNDKKTIEVQLTSATVINKKIYIVPKGIKPGVTYTPEIKNTQGSIADLTPGISIYLESKENLYTTDKVTAVKIDIETFENQK